MEAAQKLQNKMQEKMDARVKAFSDFLAYLTDIASDSDKLVMMLGMTQAIALNSRVTLELLRKKGLVTDAEIQETINEVEQLLAAQESKAMAESDGGLGGDSGTSEGGG
jgi:hypothetical protein